jgi:hypothetical protein
MSARQNHGEELAVQEYERDRAERNWRGWRHEEETKDNYEGIETLEDMMFGPDVPMTEELADAVYELRLDLGDDSDNDSDGWPYDDNYDNEPTHEQVVHEAYQYIEEQARRDDEIDTEMRLCHGWRNPATPTQNL